MHAYSKWFYINNRKMFAPELKMTFLILMFMQRIKKQFNGHAIEINLLIKAHGVEI